MCFVLDYKLRIKSIHVSAVPRALEDTGLRQGGDCDLSAMASVPAISIQCGIPAGVNYIGILSITNSSAGRVNQLVYLMGTLYPFVSFWSFRPVNKNTALTSGGNYSMHSKIDKQRRPPAPLQS
jgi:hypothetical protein